MCRELSCLPRGGGLLDQDAKEALIMQAVISAQNEKQAQESKAKQSGAKR